MSDHADDPIEYSRPGYYPKQYAAIFDERRMSVIEASTKAGKTSGCIGWLVEEALKGQKGWNYWWIAPVTPQAAIAFRRTKASLNPGSYVAHETYKTITLLNGATIWFRGADRPDTLYGEDVYAAVIDEASRMKDLAWHAIRSTLTYTRGPIRIIGNVRGRKNWAFRLARMAEKGDDPHMGFHRLVAWDAIEAGVLDQEEVDFARRELPEQVWRELYLAEPSDDGGNPFGLQHIEACLVPGLSGKPPIVWGWDLGKRQDYTVGVGLDEDKHVAQFHRWHAMPWPDIEFRIVEATGNAPALVDCTGLGDPVLDHLQQQGRAKGCRFEGYHFSPARKQKMLEGLMVAIQRHEVGIPESGPGQELRYELESFEFEITRTGYRYQAAEGFYDDCVMALGLAVEHRVHHRRAPMNISEAVLARAARPPGGTRVNPFGKPQPFRRGF